MLQNFSYIYIVRIIWNTRSNLGGPSLGINGDFTLSYSDQILDLSIDGVCRISINQRRQDVQENHRHALQGSESSVTVDFLFISILSYIQKSANMSGPSGNEALEVVQRDGVWSVNGPRSREGCYYVYEVSVYHPSTLKIEKCIANDPYARGLLGDGQRTFLANLDSDPLKPQEWGNLADEKPKIADFSDISMY
ncbi:hypothetical protein L6452_31803 [Arctium lappa]|uniref:Uncharacterized protein n=1 Tax=Arctium lappa TaxID=4217 RepID=A0ACB8Z3Q5_ARCLA|nr:hypothetical protein L6452_31803 [Arctium lappa]